MAHEYSCCAHGDVGRTLVKVGVPPSVLQSWTEYLNSCTTLEKSPMMLMMKRSWIWRHFTIIFQRMRRGVCGSTGPWNIPGFTENKNIRIGEISRCGL